MSRRFALPGGIALAALAVAAALVVLGSRDEEQPERVRGASTPTFGRATADGRLDPEVHRFGERVTATLELLVRRTDIQLNTLKATARFEPYERLGPIRREILTFPGYYLIRYTATLQCLRQLCLPQPRTAEFPFDGGFSWRTPPPPGRRFRDRRLDDRRAATPFPPATVASRITPDDLEDVRWRSSLADLPAPTYRAGPAGLAGGLLGGAVALVLAAAALVWTWARGVRSRAAALAETDIEETPLDRALARLLESRQDGGLAEQRVALETLAQELRHEQQAALAGDAERLAWSPGSPASTALDELAAAVRRLNGGSA